MPTWVKPEQRASQLIVKRDGVTACVGCGHFLFTLRRESVEFIPDEPCNRPLGAGSDEIWYDRPPDLGGFWRLATPTAYAYHLGNVPEPWMDDALREVQDAPPRSGQAPRVAAPGCPGVAPAVAGASRAGRRTATAAALLGASGPRTDNAVTTADFGNS